MADQPLPQPYSDADLAGVLHRLQFAREVCADMVTPQGKREAERSYHEALAEAHPRLAATLAELEQLRQDKERLDWLERNADEGREPGVRQIAHWLAPSDTLRAYIDRHPFGWGDAARSLPGALKEGVARRLLQAAPPGDRQGEGRGESSKVGGPAVGARPRPKAR